MLAIEAGRLPGFGDQILSFPFVQNAVGMWVNKTLLGKAGRDQAPKTWPEFEQACYDVAAATGVACYPFVESVSTFNAWLYSRGGRQLDPAGRQALFNEPAGVESLALLRRLIDAGLAWRPEEQYGDYVLCTAGGLCLFFNRHSALIRTRGRPPERRRTVSVVPTGATVNRNFRRRAIWHQLSSRAIRTEAAGWRLIRWFTPGDRPGAGGRRHAVRAWRWR
jgi:ABC-type glycerol-3-phosphate transport system substrate-binding protein